MDPELKPLVGEQIWLSERPISFFGARLRARTTVVRLEGGQLGVHRPPSPTPAFQEQLAALGTVKWLVVPNRFHHLEMPAFRTAYPEATVVGPKSALARNPKLKIDKFLGEAGVTHPEELEALPIAGVPFLDETTFFHRPTATLIGCDMLICACVRDHWTWRYVAKLSGRYDKLGIPPEVWLMTRRRDETARAIDDILARPIQQLSVAHADLVVDRRREKLAAAWNFVLGMWTDGSVTKPPGT